MDTIREIVSWFGTDTPLEEDCSSDIDFDYESDASESPSFSSSDTNSTDTSCDELSDN